jgi:hypothetical protein
MDPLTILALARGSYEAVRAGISAGREIQGMFKDVSSLMDSFGQITRMAAEPPRPGLFDDKTPEQIAVDAYMAKAEIQTMFEEVKNTFISEFGIGAWDSILKDITRIKKEQAAARLQAAKEAEERLRFMLFVIPILGAPLLILTIIVVAIWRS